MGRSHGRVKARNDGSVSEAIRNFHESGIVAVRRSKSGEILAVKTATLGWMTPGNYGLIKEVKDAYPVIAEAIRAGYELKAWVWGSTISLDVIASGASIPSWAVLSFIILTEITVDEYTISQVQPLADKYRKAATDLAAQAAAVAKTSPYGTQDPGYVSLMELSAQATTDANTITAAIQKLQKNVLFLELAVILPFGELYLAYHYGSYIVNWAEGSITSALSFFQAVTGEADTLANDVRGGLERGIKSLEGAAASLFHL